jgi:hypothetical protein
MFKSQHHLLQQILHESNRIQTPLLQTMPTQHRHQPSKPENPPPASFSYTMGTRERFLPINMREGRPIRLIKSAVTLSNWARANVQDIDSFLAYESAFSLIADDLDDLFCPHNTIIKIFYTSFRKKELAQFRWFIHGVQFPRKFSDPIAHQERHGAALAIFPQTLEDDTDLRRYLLYCQADEIGMQIGIDFLEIPAKRVEYQDMDEYINYFAANGWDREEEDTRYSPSPPYPATPQLEIRNVLPKIEPPAPDPRPPRIGSSLRALLNAISVHRSVDQTREAPGHTSNYQATRDRHSTCEDSSSDTTYGNPTTDPMHPDSYDW